MRTKTLLLAALALAACNDSPTTSILSAPSGAPRDAAENAFSYNAPVTAEGYLTGADGVQLFYRVVGNGPDSAVVLTGGPGLALSYLDPDLRPLAQGRTLIFFDQRGAGKSQLINDPSQLTIQKQVEDLEAVRQHFGIGKLKIIGHSWGAMVAPFYAAAHPATTDRLVMITPGPIETQYDAVFEATRVSRTDPAVLQHQLELFGLLASGQSPDPVATCEELFHIWFPAYFQDPANIAHFRGKFCDEPAAAANNLLFVLFAGRASLGQSWDLRPLLATVQAPALVIHGAGDAIPFASTSAYAQAMPNAELLVIQGAGHFPWLEQPVQTFTAINTFLRRGDVR